MFGAPFLLFAVIAILIAAVGVYAKSESSVRSS